MDVIEYPQRMWIAAAHRPLQARRHARRLVACHAVPIFPHKIPGIFPVLALALSLLFPIARNAFSQEIAAASSALPANPGFEQNSVGAISDWQLEPATAIPANGTRVVSSLDTAVAVLPDAAHSGASGLMLSSTTPDGSVRYALVRSSRLPVVAGFDYELSFHYLAQGLQKESADRQQYCALIVDVFFENESGFLGSARQYVDADAANWVTSRQPMTAPDGAQTAEIRIQLVNQFPGAQALVCLDDFSFTAMDAPLLNGGFEAGSGTAPAHWQAGGSGLLTWSQVDAHSGLRSVRCLCPTTNRVCGWTNFLPVRLDRVYALSGYVKASGLIAGATGGGAALKLEFLDASSQVLSTVASPGLANTSGAWIKASTAPVSPPAEAVMARICVGIWNAKGYASFDDIECASQEPSVSALATSLAIDASAQYATNLLLNGNVESGTGDIPSNWTFFGSDLPNWNPNLLTRYQQEGYPPFEIGRGSGGWERAGAYQGNGALRLSPQDPPVSDVSAWHGSGPVDGYWLSDAAACTPGQAYLASAWIKPSRAISDAWLGPLEIQFFDAQGQAVAAGNQPVRPGLNAVPAGAWSYWVTRPWVAPQNARWLRLRFGQELRADAGGWGRLWGDNFAVWPLPAGAALASETNTVLNPRQFKLWFSQAHQILKPPYLPSSPALKEAASCWGRMDNSVAGNLFHDPAAGVPLRFSLQNLRGESRVLTLRLTRSDWAGSQDGVRETEPMAIGGFAQQVFDLDLPAWGAYGAFHVAAEILEAGTVVGAFAGRYAQLPALARPRTTSAPWAVTPLVNLAGDNNAFESELGYLLKTAGFHYVWERLYFPADTKGFVEALARKFILARWYRQNGLIPIVQLMPTAPQAMNATRARWQAQLIATSFRWYHAAYGVWGIEQANSDSPYRGSGKSRLGDATFDNLAASLAAGLREITPNTTILTGNIATDQTASTLKRMLASPAAGQLDGAILNAYQGVQATVLTNSAVLQAQGQRAPQIWLEETAEPSSPFEGEARLTGEAEGARQMVRTWLSLLAAAGPQLKAVTVWGFVTDQESDIMMVTPGLQPRPHFVAHAVMADALADARFMGDGSTRLARVLWWQRTDDSVMAAWMRAGRGTVTIETSSASLRATDLMGNVTHYPATQGAVTLPLDTSPVFISGQDLRLAPE